MASDSVTLAGFGWFLARLASTTILVAGVVFSAGWFLYNEAVRGFETTFAQLNASVSDIRSDMREVRQAVDSVDERTASQFKELFAKDGVLQVSLTGDIGQLTGEIRVTNERLNRLASEIEATNKNLDDFHEDFRNDRRIESEFRSAVLQYIGRKTTP